MVNVDFSTVVCCSPSFYRVAKGNYVAVLTLDFESGERGQIKSPPYKNKNRAIAMATLVSILLIERSSNKKSPSA
jgi:hypothetical protein